MSFTAAQVVWEVYCEGEEYLHNDSPSRFIRWYHYLRDQLSFYYFIYKIHHSEDVPVLSPKIAMVEDGVADYDLNSEEHVDSPRRRVTEALYKMSLDGSKMSRNIMPRLVYYALRHGAHPTWQHPENKDSALHNFATNAAYSAIDVLLYDPQTLLVQPDGNGNTPLHRAAISDKPPYGKARTIQIILEKSNILSYSSKSAAHQYVDIINNERKTALFMAWEEKCWQSVRALLLYGHACVLSSVELLTDYSVHIPILMTLYKKLKEDTGSAKVHQHESYPLNILYSAEVIDSGMVDYTDSVTMLSLKVLDLLTSHALSIVSIVVDLDDCIMRVLHRFWSGEFAQLLME